MVEGQQWSWKEKTEENRIQKDVGGGKITDTLLNGLLWGIQDPKAKKAITYGNLDFRGKV